MAQKLVELSDELRNDLSVWLMRRLEDIDSTLELRRSEWDGFIAQYKVKREEDNKEFPWPGCSNVFLPETANVVSGVTSFIMANVVEQSPMFLAKAYRKEDEDTATALERWTSFYATIIQEQDTYWRQHYPYLALLGTHVTKLERGGEVDGWPKVTMRNVPLSRFFVYPGDRNTSVSSIVADVCYVRKSQIVEWMREGLFDSNTADLALGAYADEFGKTDEFSTERLLPNGISPDFIPIYDCYVTWGPDEYDEREYRVVFEKTRKVILWVEEWPAKDRPYHLIYFRRDEDDIFGVGIGDLIWSLQAALNTTFNQAIDNSTIANTRMWLVSNNSNVDPDEAIFPGKIFKGSADSVKPLAAGDIYPSSLNNQLSIRQSIERATGVSENFLGLDSSISRTRQTAQGQALNIQEGSRRMNLVSQEFEKGIVELAWKTLEMLALVNPFLDIQEVPDQDDSLVSILDSFQQRGSSSTLGAMLRSRLEDEEAEAIERTVLALPDVLVNRGKFRLSAARRSANKQVDQQASMVLSQIVNQYLNQVIQFAAQIEQSKAQGVQGPMVSAIEGAWKASNDVMKKVLAAFNVEDASDILIALGDINDVFQYGNSEQPRENVERPNQGLGEVSPVPTNPGGVSGGAGAAFGALGNLGAGGSLEQAGQGPEDPTALLEGGV